MNGGASCASRLVLLVFAWSCILPQALGDLLTFNFTGVVLYEGRTEGTFAAGRPFVMAFTLDVEAAGRGYQPCCLNYTNALKELLFDYDFGSYQGRTEGPASVEVRNNINGHDVFQLNSAGSSSPEASGFPPVGGEFSSGIHLTLSASNGLAFASSSLPRQLPLYQFNDRRLQIDWGIDFEMRYIALRMDSITVTPPGPAIVAWSTVNGALSLTIRLPDPPETSTLERSFKLGPEASWEPVATFPASGWFTTWTGPLISTQPGAFYRLRLP